MELKAGYKQTEVGVIPGDWEETKLADGITLLSGQHILANYCNTLGIGVPYITGPADFPDGVISHSKFTSRPSTICKTGDILVTVKGSGAGSLVVADGVYCISRQLMAIRISSWDKSFVFYSLLQNATQFKSASTGLIPGLSRSDINDQVVPIPPLPEQSAIAAALSDVDALLSGLDKLIAKKHDLKQAAMQQLLTGKMRLPGFGGEWVVKRLGDVLTIRHGKDQKAVVSSGGQYPILATGGQIGWAKQWLYDKPSVLIGRKGTIDRPQYMDKPFWTVDTLFYSELKSENVAKYLYYRFCMIDWQQYNEASGVPSLNARTIENIEFACPVPEEQAAIANVLSDMDAELAALKARREKTKLLKLGMMQELLTGKTRLV